MAKTADAADAHHNKPNKGYSGNLNYQSNTANNRTLITKNEVNASENSK